MAAVLTFNNEWFENCTKIHFLAIFLVTPDVKGLYHVSEIWN